MITYSPVDRRPLPRPLSAGRRAAPEAAGYDLATVALQALADNLAEGLIIADGDGRIVAVNRTTELLLGWSARELLGRPCRRFMRCLDEDALGQYRASCRDGCLSGNAETVHRMLRTAMGGRLAVSAKSLRLFGESDEPLGVLCTFSVGRRDGLLDRAAAEFLSNVSHELRTPLSSLATSVELLSSGYQRMPKEDVGHVLRVVHHSMLQMRNLVENLLSASSIQLGCFHVQPRLNDLGEIVDEAVTFVQPILEKKRQRLVQQMPAVLPLVTVDSRRIVQVIVNLLSNACKYGPPGDEIVLSIIRRARHVVVSVAENGPGIAPEEQRSIFERFYRSRHNGLEGPQGVGLGLALVKSIVTAHGGKVGVQSKLGAGATFWFTLPVPGGSRRQRGKESRREGADR